MRQSSRTEEEHSIGRQERGGRGVTEFGGVWWRQSRKLNHNYSYHYNYNYNYYYDYNYNNYNDYNYNYKQ